MESLTFALVFILVSIVAMVTQSKEYQFDVTWQMRSPDCVERAITAINGGFPGPTLRVKPGEQVVVKVVNHLLSDALTIHWHGQRQYKNVWHDGAGMISGCPIPPHSSFTYIFKANDVPGTYFYHGHLGGIRAAGERSDEKVTMTSHSLLSALCTCFDWLIKLGCPHLLYNEQPLNRHSST